MNGAERVGVIVAWVLVVLVAIYLIGGFMTCLEEGLGRDYYEKQDFLREMGEP